MSCLRGLLHVVRLALHSQKIFFFSWQQQHFQYLGSLCLAINKSPRITGEAGSEYSCMRVWAGQKNDWSSGGLSTRKNVVWWDCRLGGRWEGDRCWFHVWGNPQAHSTRNWKKIIDDRGGGVFVFSGWNFSKVPNKANSSLIRVKSGILWHLAPFFYFSDGPNCRHIPNCTVIIMSEPGLLIGPGSSQWEGRKWVTGLSALTWYFTWRRSEPASHYLSNTVYNWGSLCPVKSSSQGVPLYLGSATQR